MITHHTQLLNALIEKYGLKSYLEIGVQNPKQNFDKINSIGGLLKHGVDPELGDSYNGLCQIFGVTSDKFFTDIEGSLFKYDLIFIDGLHTAEQVKKDFENSLRCLSDNGFILIHDVLPENEAGTRVPRQTKQWWGTVYQWALAIGDYTGISFKTFAIDNGCMLVWKDEKAKNDYGKNLSITYDWMLYKTLGRTLMNVTDAVDI